MASTGKVINRQKKRCIMKERRDSRKTKKINRENAGKYIKPQRQVKLGQRPLSDKKLRREEAKLQKKNAKKELKRTLKNQMDEEIE